MNAIKEIAVIYGAGFGSGIAVCFFCMEAFSLICEVLVYFKNKNAAKGDVKQ